MTDFFPAGRTRYPGRNAEEKTIPILSAQNVGALEKILCTQEIELNRLKIGTNSFYRL